MIGSTTGFVGTYAAYGGIGHDAGGAPAYWGAAGTIFIRAPGAVGTLIVDNNNNPLNASYTKMVPGDYTNSFDAVQLKRGANLWLPYSSTFSMAVANVSGDALADQFWIDGTLNSPAALAFSSFTLTISSFSTAPNATSLNIGPAGTFNLGGHTQSPIAGVSTVTIQSGGTLTHWANGSTAAGEFHKLTLALSSMTILAGGSINVTGMGYAAGNGPGIGTVSGNGGYGGSYGGQGDPAAGTNGPTYGLFSAPTNIGSGGAGSSGGGAVILTVTSMTVNGSITANGVSNNGTTGEGSGGSIFITAGSLTGTAAGSIRRRRRSDRGVRLDRRLQRKLCGQRRQRRARLRGRRLLLWRGRNDLHPSARRRRNPDRRQ